MRECGPNRVKPLPLLENTCRVFAQCARKHSAVLIVTDKRFGSDGPLVVAKLFRREVVGLFQSATSQDLGIGGRVLSREITDCVATAPAADKMGVEA